MKKIVTLRMIKNKFRGITGLEKKVKADGSLIKGRL